MDYFNVFSSLTFSVTSVISSGTSDEPPPSKVESEHIPMDWESGGGGAGYCVIS